MAAVGLSLLVLMTLAWHALGQAPAEVVQISLRPFAEAQETCVRLGDVADITGGAEALRCRLAQIDVTEIPGQERGVIVSRDQLSCRLQLAGWPPPSFRLEGAV